MTRLQLSEAETRVVKVVDRNREAGIALLKEMLGASRDGDGAIQRVVERELKDLGGSVDVFEADLGELRSHPEFTLVPELEKMGTKDRPNVVGTLPGSGKGRSILLFAHVDSYELDSANWSFDPYDATVTDDGRIYGHGVSDDRSGVASMILAVRALRESGVQLDGDVIVVSCLGKHFGAGGTLAVVDRQYAADAAVYLHPAETGRGLKEFKPMSLGLVQFQVSVSGEVPKFPERLQTPAAHRGVNAITKAEMIMRALREWDQEVVASWKHSLVDETLGRSGNLLISSIAGGHADRQVPVECSFSGSVVFAPGRSAADIRTAIENVIAETSTKDLWLSAHPPQLTWMPGFANPCETDMASPLIENFVECVRLTNGQEPVAWPAHTASDIRFPLIYSSAPTIGFGPLGGGFGGPDEWLDLGEFQEAITALSLLMMRWCGVVDSNPRA